MIWVDNVKTYNSKNAITDITGVELYFHIFNLESWDTIFDSDVITISF